MQTPPPVEPLDYETWERRLDYAGGYDPAEVPRVFLWKYHDRMSAETLQRAIHLIWVRYAEGGLLDLPGLLGAGYGNLLLALVISSWATDARIARALTMEARTFPFVTAARISGSSTAAIGVRHILPAVLPQIAIISTLRLGGIVVSPAGLSFLGLGVQMPTAELGAMLGDGRRFLTAAPWLLVAPSVAILLIATGANLLAEGLQQKSSKGSR